MSKTILNGFGAYNPSHATTMQVGFTSKSDSDTTLNPAVPPGWPIWAEGHAGRGNNRVPKGTPRFIAGNKFLGVSIEGIQSVLEATRHPESCGRHSVAVSGVVKIHAVLKNDADNTPKKPDLLSELWVGPGTSNFYIISNGVGDNLGQLGDDDRKIIMLPPYSDRKENEYNIKIGIVQAVDTNPKSCEVTVHLQRE